MKKEMTLEEKKEALSRAALEIKNPIRSWWAGDSRVSEFIEPLNSALDRSGKNLTRDERTDIYNRAYEAIYKAILKYDKKKVVGEL